MTMETMSDGNGIGKTELGGWESSSTVQISKDEIGLSYVVDEKARLILVTAIKVGGNDKVALIGERNSLFYYLLKVLQVI